MNVSDQILEMLWNYIPADVEYSTSYYPRPRSDAPDELYINVYGKCYQIVVKEHPHPHEEGDNW